MPRRDVHRCQMFQVIYASIVIFNALLSRLLLGRRLNSGQWLAIVVVTAGLALSVIGMNVTRDDKTDRASTRS